jgi:DNA adenine methylase
MSEYICSSCKQVFTQRGRYDSHVARKRPCKISSELTSKSDEITSIIKDISNLLINEIIDPTDLPSHHVPIEKVKPFLKWVGGKTQIIDEVTANIPLSMNNYYEPFIGGGSVLFAILHLRAENKIIIHKKICASDLNPYLIGLYKNIQKNVDELIIELKSLVIHYGECEDGEVNRKADTFEDAMKSKESYYYWIRSSFNKMTPQEKVSVKGSAMFLFLNKTCFRGLYREGPRGFNVPFGNYDNPSVYDAVHLHDVATLIKDVEFQCTHFKDVLEKANKDDFYYLDPPYAPENEKSFVGYTADGFSLKEHTLLFGLCAKLNTNGTKLLLSNANVSLVKDSFPSPPFETKIISARRAIHSKTPSAKTEEVLIKN